ncbi:hypothetical protein LTR98_011988, partial [Exophiala xenobiotica]
MESRVTITSLGCGMRLNHRLGRKLRQVLVHDAFPQPWGDFGDVVGFAKLAVAGLVRFNRAAKTS